MIKLIVLTFITMAAIAPPIGTPVAHAGSVDCCGRNQCC